MLGELSSDFPERHSTTEIQINYMIWNTEIHEILIKDRNFRYSFFLQLHFFLCFHSEKKCATIYEIFSTIFIFEKLWKLKSNDKIMIKYRGFAHL